MYKSGQSETDCYIHFGDCQRSSCRAFLLLYRLDDYDISCRALITYTTSRICNFYEQGSNASLLFSCKNVFFFVNVLLFIV